MRDLKDLFVIFMSSELRFGVEARESLRLGAEKVYKAVSSTLGARGRNVVRQNFGRPKITNDGVTIARSIDLKDPFEKQGADLLKEAAERTVSQAGDGTTTSIVLSYSFLTEGLLLIKQGENSMVLRKKIELEVERVVTRLKEMAIPVSSNEDLERIATISVENPEYGKIIASAVKTVGKDGIVLVDEDPSTLGIRSEEINGYRFDKGLENPYLVTNIEKMEAVLEETPGCPIYVLVADKQWNLVGDLMPLFEELKKKGCDKILIIADDISGELMSFITINRVKQRFHAVVVKCPFNKDTLEDIAAMTGATAITGPKGIVTPNFTHLGTAQKIVVTKETTTIIGGGGDPKKAIDALRQQVADADEGYDKEKLQERLAKLTGKTILMKVGASTEAESKYLRDKLDDAIAATRAAVEEGVVAGGGMALARIAEELYDDDDQISHLMSTVLVSPLVKIMLNAGVDNEEVGKIEVKMSKNLSSGYDALKGEFVPDIVAAGILDPLKVTRCALKNAASLAVMLLTCETIIATIEDS